MELIKSLETALSQIIQPSLANHGGGIQVLDLKDGVLYIALTGHCSNCPAANFSTCQWIQEELSPLFPEIRRVVPVQTVSNELLNQAKNFLQNG